MLNGTSVDSFAISETKLDANALDEEIKINGYVACPLDSNRNEQLESQFLKNLTD